MDISLPDNRLEVEVNADDKCDIAPLDCEVKVKTDDGCGVKIEFVACEKTKTGSSKEHKCSFCSSTFSSSAELISHKLETNHFKEIEKRVYSRKHKCSFCSTVFRSYAKLKSHKLETNHFKEYKCHFCKKEYTTESDLNKHREVHLICDVDENGYKCEVCEKAFPTTNEWFRHKKLHTNERFECDICGISFSYMYNLRRHREKHYEKNPKHKCDFCSATFGSSADLRLHKREKKHLEEYMCTFCGKIYFYSSSLVQHMRLHTKQRFECDVCDKSFYVLEKLQAHKRIHTYICEVCGEGFIKLYQLEEHKLKNCHKECPTVATGTSVDSSATIAAKAPSTSSQQSRSEKFHSV